MSAATPSTPFRIGLPDRIKPEGNRSRNGMSRAAIVLTIPIMDWETSVPRPCRVPTASPPQ